MISQGRVSKVTDASTTSRKYKQREGDTVTLGSVFNRLNLASEKKVAIIAKKVVISERLNQASSVHEFSTSGEAKDPHDVIFEMKSMRKSLQNQLKKDRYYTACPEERLKKLSTRKQARGERGCSTKPPGRDSNSSAHTEVLTKRIEKEKMYCRKESRRAPLNSKKQMPSCLNGFMRNVYSRHMAAPTPRIFVENNVDDYAEMDLGKNSTSAACATLKNEAPIPEIDIDNVSDLENSNCGSEGACFIAGEAELGVLGPEKIQAPEEISLKEKEVINKLTDPQLKESVQNIIKRRRSSVRFARSESRYDISSLEKTISEQHEANTDQYRQEQLDQLAESNSVVEESQESDVLSVKSANSRRASVNRERSTSVAGSVTSERSHALTSPPQPRARTRTLASQEQHGVPTARIISSARSCESPTSIQTRRSVSSPILRRRKPEIQTGETRVIRPATSKGYVPTLTYRKLSRKQSPISCQEIPHSHRDQNKNLAQVNMIREFLLMYAKVTTKKDETLPGRVPVRMMSQTPEFVIKSAIGQFLTCAFPSGESEEWPGLRNQSKKERYEEQQRSKLLRIKICMKHLASVT